MCNDHAGNERQTKNYYPIQEDLLNVELTYLSTDQSPAFVFFTLPILLSKKRIRSEPIMTPML